MSRIVECVPNFSEGQHKEVIEAIASAISSTDGCNLLDVDPGISTNRTVYTFVGSPESVVEGALNGARASAHYIDMTKHRGEHPRLGALDVCPFVPVQGVTMEECVECAKEFGERLAMELGVPVYLYGEASDDDKRKSVPQIRAGEYEGLPEKLSKSEWKPNYGPADFVPNWGATIVGARKFLIAYNINMLSTKEQAHRIALNIREQGRGQAEEGEHPVQPGRLKKVQAIGWYLEEANMAQVSVNITDFETTPIHVVYEEAYKDAKDLNLAVCGSQIVGLVPLQAIMDCAEYYMKKENLFILEEDQKIRLVVDRLGLHSLGGFSPKERIIEYMITEEKYGPLAQMEVKDFVFTVGARSPSPGGGSVAALTASMGAALTSMAGFLTYGNKKFAPLDPKMRELLPTLYTAMKDLVPFVDHDAAAFSDYMALKALFNPEEYEDYAAELLYSDRDIMDQLAYYLAAIKMPKKDAEEEAFDFSSGDSIDLNSYLDKKWREQAMQRALRAAINVPMTVAKKTNSVWPELKELAKICNLNCKSDLQVGVKCLETGVYGAYYNVLINLKDVKDEKFKAELQKDIQSELKTAQEGCAEVLKIVEARKE